MLHRHTQILDLLRTAETVEVEGLATHFGVTTQTIRNDLRLLDRQGLADRTHGGARRVLSAANPAYAERRQMNAEGKKEIAALVARLIPQNCAVSLNIGTTTEQVAQALSEHEGLTVVSNNINIINRMMGDVQKELILVGGTVRQSDGAIVGGDAVETLRRYKVDYAVIGASAIDADGSVTDHDPREVEVARAILKNARTRVLVADNSKFSQTAAVRICDIADIDYFVSDMPPPAEFAQAAAQGETTLLSPERS